MSYNFNQETRNRGQVSLFLWFLGFQIPVLATFGRGLH